MREVERLTCIIIGALLGVIITKNLTIQSVDKTGYETVAHYKLFARVYAPYELSLLCQ